MQIKDGEQFLDKDKKDALEEIKQWFSLTELDEEDPDWRKSYPFGLSQLLSECGYAKSVYCDVIEEIATKLFSAEPQNAK